MSGDQRAHSGIPCRTASARERAFTLIELLVVISIIAVLLAITIGGLFRNKAANRLLATEQLIADFVRQARHTARSSGAPVVLKVSPADPTDPTRGWVVSGVSRQCIWSESWDDTLGGSPPTPPSGVGAGGAAGGAAAGGGTTTIGLNGNGRTSINAGQSETHTLAKNEQLVRGRRQDGFYLACAVKLPLERIMPMNDPSRLPPAVIPLLLIGAAGDDQVTSSLAGIALNLATHKMQPVPGAPTGGNGGSTPTQPYLRCYELVGWVAPYNPSAASPPEADNEVSSVDPSSTPSLPDPTRPGLTIAVARDQPPLHPTYPAAGPDLDVAGPMGIDRWEEVGLLFDGSELSLYRNGQRVGERPYTGPANGLPAGKDTIFVGQASFPGVGQMYGDANAVFDDARLYRLGTDQLGQLPPGVMAVDAQGKVVNQTYRITAHPDGRVTFAIDVAHAIGRRTAASAAASGVLPANMHRVVMPGNTTETILVDQRQALVFSLEMHGERRHEAGPLNAAVVTISADGSVSSSLATWEQETGAVAGAGAALEWPVLVSP